MLSSVAARSYRVRLAAALILLAGSTPACRGRPQVPILTWHAVGTADDEFTVTPALLEQQLDALKGYRTVSLHDAMTAPQPHSLVLTFDDGTKDALDVVLPALQQRGMKATFFIVTGFVGKRGYLDWGGVATLRTAGMEVGSHSVDHARLPELSDEKLLPELVDSRRALEAHVHAPCEAFAYPYNSLRSREKAAVREAGYRWAVAGVAHGGKDPYSLYRIPVKHDTSPEALLGALY